MSAITLSYIWLIAGALLVGLEVFGLSGIGLIFAGLGAVCTGIAIELEFTTQEAILSQFAWFFGFTIVWALMLWKPLQALQRGSSARGNFKNIIGDWAETQGNGLRKGQVGTVRWSGTIMQAELAPHCVAGVPGGTRVKIVAVRGATLIVEA